MNLQEPIDNPSESLNLGQFDYTKSERDFAAIAHLSAFSGWFIPFGNIIGPLVVWLVKKDESQYVAEQALETLNFQISMTLAMIVAGILCIVLIGIPMLLFLVPFAFIYNIIGAVKASEGKDFRYPLTWRLVGK